MEAQDLDPTDLRILDILQRDARISSAELARRVDLSAPGLVKRLKKLEEAGFLKGYVTLLDREALGLDLLCFVEVTLTQHQTAAVERFRESIMDMKPVLECHHLTGDADYLLKVVVANRRALETFLVQDLSRLEGIARVHTSIVLNEVKTTTALPLPTPR